jgi:ribosome-associated toxin RatA of RatAB toxin-antitoxin module
MGVPHAPAICETGVQVKMVTIEKSCEILSSVDRVWDLLADTDRDQERWGQIRDINVLSRNGNRLEREATVGPRAFARKSRQVLVFEPRRSIQMTMSGEGISGERRIVLVPLGKNDTRVDVYWNLDIKDVPSFVQGIVRGQISKATEEALKRFKKEAEGPSSTASKQE